MTVYVLITVNKDSGEFVRDIYLDKNKADEEVKLWNCGDWFKAWIQTFEVIE
jgi:hypothetical protein